MADLNLPNTIEPLTSMDPRPIQANFQAIETHANDDVVHRDGSRSMTGALTLPGPPTADAHAATKGYVDSTVLPVGVILPYGGPSAPSGWALCQGQLVLKDDYPTLYGLLGSTYGVETGTQFYLPDLRSRFIAGKGSASWSNLLGETGGTADAVVVSHRHTYEDKYRSVNGIVDDSGSGTDRGYNPDLTRDTEYTDYEGSSATNANLPPYVTLNHIIRLG